MKYKAGLIIGMILLLGSSTTISAAEAPDPDTYIINSNHPDTAAASDSDSTVDEEITGDSTSAPDEEVSDPIIGTEYTAKGFSRTPDTWTAVLPGNTASKTARSVNSRYLRRLYNASSGEHLYTESQSEYEYLSGIGWKAEGIGWTAPRISSVPIYRLYNPNSGDHHYTKSTKERDYLASLGWKREGIGWYSSTHVSSETGQQIPVYRLFNPNAKTGSHHYTLSETEKDHLVSLGWRYEGIGWYADPDEVSTENEVIQHAGISGVQSMFYSVVTPEGHLILIDGGWAKDYETVSRVISAYDSKVDAWIITHPHPDHVGAVNEALKRNPNLQIGQIYMPQINEERYAQTAADYDEIDSWYEFRDLSAAHTIVPLSEYDSVSLFGLDMKVLHSWNETVDALDRDLLNHGGLMFTLTGPKHSMLFCADLGKPVEAEILARHGDELMCDYVQCSHHGNWGFSTTLYDRIQPLAVFMDAPDNIIRTNQHGYDGWQLVAYWNERNIPIHSFRDGDTGIIL